MITRLTAAAGLLALSAGLALAQTPTATPAEPASKADSNMKEWQVAKVAKVSLAQALTTAESQGDEKGGRAIDADFEKAGSKDPAHYAIK
ncbi:MAG: peptidase M4, partial [Actinomycetospora chiangmaiensis]|nr:peptidase M4 [Actinomycetospora chiangmaiensis]